MASQDYVATSVRAKWARARAPDGPVLPACVKPPRAAVSYHRLSKIHDQSQVDYLYLLTECMRLCMCMCVTVCVYVSQDYRKRYVVLDHSSLKMYRKETVSYLSAVDTQHI